MHGIAIPNSLSNHHNFALADRVVQQLDLVDDAMLHELIQEVV
jgi:hypothetical protein